MDENEEIVEGETPTENEAPTDSEPDFSELSERLDRVLAGIDGMQRTLAALIAANGGGVEKKETEISIDDVTPDDDFDFDFE